MQVIVRLPNGLYLGYGNTGVPKSQAKVIDLSDHPEGAVLPGEPETIMEQARDQPHLPCVSDHQG